MTDQAAAAMGATKKRMLVRISQKTDVGLVRSENQDFAILTSPEEEMDHPHRGRLMVVADGMGGHRGGATASRMAGETIKSHFLNSNYQDTPAALRSALEMANAAIYAEAQSNPELRGMGTTCSALVIEDDHAYFAHVGDSRIYLTRDGEIHQLTQDHSLVASMVREGLITAQEAEVHPRRNVLQRSMGVVEHVEVDVSEPFPIQVGDTFILCSDGLHGLVRAPEMLEVAAMPIDNAVSEFIQRAIERGAHDNVTVVVARVDEIAVEEDPVQDSGEPEAAVMYTAADFEDLKPAKKEIPHGEGGFVKWLVIMVVVIGLVYAAIVYKQKKDKAARQRQVSPITATATDTAPTDTTPTDTTSATPR
ncbi:MAG: Stp1/IreP family PP2C-type Ser/Thr phosphatase [Acidobacteriota bacterium]